jgi:hypothetical protein
LTILLLLIGISIPVQGQQFTGTIRGTVQDAAGAVVAGAEVSVVNKWTNETRNVVTEGNGGYVVPQLKPGLYRINVKRTGFKTATLLDEVKVDVQQIREVDAPLAVGETIESVTITSSGAAAIEVTSSTVSQKIDLPLNEPNGQVDSTNFGIVGSQGNGPRQIQLALKLIF